MRRLLAILLTIILSGCAGVGLMPTSDPNIKIQQAYRMIDEDRALIAEDLIRQAMALYHESGNTEGMAEAYFTYGNLYKHPTYHNNSAAFEKFGTYDGTYKKSIENYKEAIKQFESAGSEIGVVKSLTSIGEAYNLKNDKITSCLYYEKALARYHAGKESGAITKEPVIYVHGAMNTGQIIEALMKRDGCT